MRNTQKHTDAKEKEHKENVYSLDLIEKEHKIQRFVDEPVNPLLDQYKQNLLNPPVFVKETIIFDQNTGKWKIIKDK